jgi:hypothetical protein
MRAIHYFLFGAMLILTSCSKREIETAKDTDYQFRYFPLEIGKAIQYQLDSFVFEIDTNGIVSIDSISVQVRDEMIDSTKSVTGEQNYIVVRSELRNGSWVPVRTMQVGRDENKAWRTEDQFRLLKMPFPMTMRSEWDGLTFINRETEVEIRQNRIRPFTNWEFEVDSINISKTIGTFNFDSTLTITEANDVNAIERRFSRVIYAMGVGPVFMEQWILDSQYCNQTPPPTDCESLPWEIKAERGYILRQTVISY